MSIRSILGKLFFIHSLIWSSIRVDLSMFKFSPKISTIWFINPLLQKEGVSYIYSYFLNLSISLAICSHSARLRVSHLYTRSSSDTRSADVVWFCFCDCISRAVYASDSRTWGDRRCLRARIILEISSTS